MTRRRGRMIVKLREMERRTVWVVQRDLEFVPRATEKKKITEYFPRIDVI